MERFELEEGIKAEIRSLVAADGFMKLVQTVRRGGTLFRISIRPVAIGGERRYQAEMSDGGQVSAKNFDARGIAAGLEEVLAQKGARELHVISATGDLHVRVTRKGRALVSRSAPMNREARTMPHDRVKRQPLTSFDSSALLRVTGLADGEGRVRASMRGKYDQVNEFLRLVGDAVKGADTQGDAPFAVVDCGCGKAYLTLALYFYLRDVVGFADVRVVGVDRRADVVAAASDMAARLDIANGVRFFESDLGDFSLAAAGLERADMVVSLHACDTATDEALAKGVEWKARYILSAPCCQHELHKSLGAPEAFAGLVRQSILRERLGDLLTDAFRAMIMRILGFKTQVVEFVSSEATARNVMIRCVYGVKPGQSGAVAEYLDLRDYWRVTPWLETRLKPLLGRHLERFE